MTNYYVKVGGDDLLSGLDWPNAWATLSKAATSVAPGDTVTFGDGTYSVGQGQASWITGTLGNEITFQADNPRLAIWKKSANDGAIIDLYQDNYLNFVDLIIDGDYAANAYTAWRMIEIENCSDVTFDNCEIRDGRGHGVFIQNGSNDIILQDCDIHPDVYTDGASHDGILSYGSTNYTITITGCTVYDCDHTGITMLSCDGFLIEDTEVYDTHSHCVQVGEYAGSHGWGLNGTIEYCDIHDSENYGPSDIQGHNGIYVTRGDVDQVIIQKNTLCRLDWHGIQVGLGVVGPVYIYNNTIYEANLQGKSDGACIRLNDGSAGISVVVRNNILYSTQAAGMTYNISGANMNAGLTSDYNLFYSDPGATDDVYRNGVLYGNYAAYQGAGYSPNSVINQDPDFVDASSCDFTLIWGSPAIDEGIDVGLPFSGIAPDIGAYEYDQGATTTSTSTSTTSTSTSTSTTSTSISTTTVTSTSQSTSLSTSTTSTSVSTSTTSTSTSTTSTSISTSTTSTSISTSTTTSTSTSISTSITTSLSTSTTQTRLPQAALREVCTYEHDQIRIPEADATGYVYKEYGLLALMGMNQRVLRQAQNWGMAPLHFIGQRGPYQDGETPLDMRMDPRVMQILVAEPLFRRMDFWDRRNEILDKLRPNRSFDGEVRPLVYRKWLPGGKVERGVDLVTTHGSTIVTSASGRFIERGLEAGMTFVITSGADAGTDVVVDVPNDYTVQLATACLATATGVHYEFRRGQSKRDLFCLLEAGPTFDEGPDAAPLYQTGYREALRFIAHDPCWYTAVELSETWTIEPAGANDLTFNNIRAWFPDRWLFGGSYVGNTISVIYWGTAPARPQIEITGPAEYPVIENETTGTKIEMNYIILAGETVTIDCLRLTVTNDSDVNLLPYTSGDLATFTLEPTPRALNRSNDITITFAGGEYGASAAVLKWHNRYVGI